MFKNIHCIGIGGIGVSGLARILRWQGHCVTGSDLEPSPVTNKLISENFKISFSNSAKNLPQNTNVVIHTTAVREDNPELIEARSRGLKILTYPEALGEITHGKKLIAIAGAHGKTTTTSLLIAGCLAANEDISCIVGTNLKELKGGNARVGKSNWFILEACEYRRAFLNLTPNILIVTNVEAEHLDYYRDLEDYQSAFVELVKKMPANGVLIANSAEPNLKVLIEAAPKFIDVTETHCNTSLSGEHNRKNATLALVAAKTMGLDVIKAEKGIENFTGGWRRFEKKGEYQGALVFDDYGHHPTEIKATLAGAREKFPNRRIIIVYQQHQLSRATKLFSELGKSFQNADVIIIPNIYKVRDEEGSANVSAEDLVNEIKKNNSAVYYTHDFDGTIQWLKENIKKNDLLIIMGAGDVFRITERLLSTQLRE